MIKNITLRLNLDNEKDARVAEGLKNINRTVHGSMNKFLIHAVDAWLANEKEAAQALSQEEFLKEIKRAVREAIHEEKRCPPEETEERP